MTKSAPLIPSRFGGVLAAPGEAIYEQACDTYNLAAPLRPAAAVLARSTEDVVAALDAARRARLSISVSATGHSAASHGPLDASVLVHTAFDAPVKVEPILKTARVPAGATWGAVVAAAARYGLAALHGSSPTVGGWPPITSGPSPNRRP